MYVVQVTTLPPYVLAVYVRAVEIGFGGKFLIRKHLSLSLAVANANALAK